MYAYFRMYYNAGQGKNNGVISRTPAQGHDHVMQGFSKNPKEINPET